MKIHWLMSHLTVISCISVRWLEHVIPHPAKHAVSSSQTLALSHAALCMAPLACKRVPEGHPSQHLPLPPSIIDTNQNSSSSDFESDLGIGKSFSFLTVLLCIFHQHKCIESIVVDGDLMLPMPSLEDLTSARLATSLVGPTLCARQSCLDR